MRKIIYLLLPILFLHSCVEIIDDLTINSDGSGTFKYVVNLSQSKVKVNSILALDSLDGKKVPSIEVIKQIVVDYKEKLEEKSGISNVKVETDYTFFILKFQCDFEDVESLQKAIKEIALEEDKKKEFNEFSQKWLDFDGSKLVRSVPALTAQTTQKLKKEEAESLKNGTYTSITRFDRIIERCENPKTIIPASKTVCAIKTTPFALLNNMHLLENTIYLSNTKK